MDKELVVVPKPSGLIYFERMELFMVVASLVVCGVPIYILAMLGLLVELTGFIVIATAVIFTMFVHKPYSRAKFIRQGGAYRLRERHIDFISGDGRRHGFSIDNMGLKVCRRGDRVDLLFGKNIFDFIKHYGSKRQQGAGLYSIDINQLDDVLAMLKVS